MNAWQAIRARHQQLQQRVELLKERTEDLFLCLGEETVREEQVLVDKDEAMV